MTRYYYFLIFIIPLSGFVLSERGENDKDSIIYADNQAVSIDSNNISDLLNLKWAVPYKNKRGLPYLYNGILFATYSTKYAFDAETGKKLYFNLIKNQKRFRDCCPDSIFKFEKQNQIYVLNIYTGEVLYSSFRDSKYPIWKTPRVVKDSLLFTVIKDSELVAYNLFKDTLVWKYSSSSSIYDHSVCYKDEVIMSNETNLLSLSRSEGEVLWKEDIGMFVSNPILVGNKLYVFIKDKGVYCINLERRKVEWIFSETENILNQQIKLVVDGEKIYFQSEKIYCISKNNGQLIWKSKIPASSYYTTLTMVKNFIITYTEDELYNDNIIIYDKINGNLVFENAPSSKLNKTELSFKSNTFRFADSLFNNNLYGIGWDSIYCFEIIE